MTLNKNHTITTLPYSGNPSSKEPKKIYIDTEFTQPESHMWSFSSKLCLKALKEYKKDFMEVFNEESTQYNIAKYLRKYSLKPKDRAGAVDWMLRVMHEFDCKKEAFFKAVALMDSFFAKTKAYMPSLDENGALSPDELYLAGAASMFLGSKLVDYRALGLGPITEKIGCNRFSKAEVKQREIEITKLHDYDIDIRTTYDIIEQILTDLTFSYESSHDNNEIKKIENIKNLSVYYAIVCCHDSAILKYKYDSSSEICSTIILGYASICTAILLNKNKIGKEMEELMWSWLVFWNCD